MREICKFLSRINKGAYQIFIKISAQLGPVRENVLIRKDALY